MCSMFRVTVTSSSVRQEGGSDIFTARDYKSISVICMYCYIKL